MKTKGFILIIALGLILRLVIAAVTYHPDVGIVGFTSAIILREHNLNPYDFESSLEKTDVRKPLFVGETADDLPLQYWIRLPVELVTRFLINTEVEDQFLVGITPLLGSVNLLLHLIYIKLPLIIFDLLAGAALTLLFPPLLRRKALFFWMVNPMTLWATAAVGQVDILPTFFVVLSAVLLQKGKLSFSAFSLGLGAALKSFPFLLAPFLIFYAKGWPERIKIALLIAVPWIVSILPYLGSVNFRQNALFAPQLDKMLYAQFPLSGGESLVAAIVILFVLYFIYMLKQRNFNEFLAFSTSALLVILALTHFHIQWFLWVTPFLIFYLIRGAGEAQKLSIVLISAAVLMMLFLFEASLQVRLFAPIFPGLAGANGLPESLRPEQLNFLRSIAASLFAAGSLFFCGTLLYRRNLDG